MGGRYATGDFKGRIFLRGAEGKNWNFGEKDAWVPP